MPLDFLLCVFSSYVVSFWSLFKVIFCINSFLGPLNRDPDNIESIIGKN